MIFPRFALAGMVLALSACAVGPDYQRPDAPLGEQFREEVRPTAWKPAEPADLQDRGPWWESLNDGVLNTLMQNLNEQNFTLQQAQARVRQAQATLSGTRATQFPQVGSPVGTTRRGGGPGDTSQSSSAYDASVTVNWEVDLWGRIRRQVEAGDAGLQASAADMAATRLSLQSQLAQTYLQYRSVESSERV